jgi:hypothetical protein
MRPNASGQQPAHSRHSVGRESDASSIISILSVSVGLFFLFKIHQWAVPFVVLVGMKR